MFIRHILSKIATGEQVYYESIEQARFSKPPRGRHRILFRCCDNTVKFDFNRNWNYDSNSCLVFIGHFSFRRKQKGGTDINQASVAHSLFRQNFLPNPSFRYSYGHPLFYRHRAYSCLLRRSDCHFLDSCRFSYFVLGSMDGQSVRRSIRQSGWRQFGAVTPFAAFLYLMKRL